MASRISSTIKDNLETVVAAMVIIAMTVGALMFLATKAEVQAVDKKIELNRLNDQLREVNSAIIQTDKQLMWMEQKLSAENKNCALDTRWRELRNELDLLKQQRASLHDQINRVKTGK